MAEDKNLLCRDCNKTFVFTAGEQTFFAEKGLSDPIRCPDCRRARKQQRMADSPSAYSDSPRSSGGAPRSAPTAPRSFGPSTDTGFRRTATAPADAPARGFRTGGSIEEDDNRVHRKQRPPAAKFTPPKKEQAAVPKEKRPNNRRGEEELLLNWKEEVGLDDEIEDGDDWLALPDEDEEE